jgi:hypothetical protein
MANPKAGNPNDNAISICTMGTTWQWLWEYLPRTTFSNMEMANAPSFPPLQSGLKRLQNAFIAAICSGPCHNTLPSSWMAIDATHAPRVDTAEGHYSGAETLKQVPHPEPFVGY